MELAEKLSTIDLVNVVESYGIDLKRSGNRFKAVCPFHADKDPSLVIYTGGRKQTWRCFGCGKYGDVADFIAEYERISVKDALRRLGVSESKPHTQGQRKYYSQRKSLVDEFKKRVKDTIVCLGLLMQMWEEFTRTPENAFDHPEGYDIFNQWWDWQERLILGKDSEKYEITKTVDVKTLTDQARAVGIL